MSPDPKEVLGGIAIALTFLAFFPYIRSIHQAKIRPHVFSWIIWGSTTFIVFLAQLSDGGGAGAWPIGVSGLITLYIAVLAYLKKADSSITPADWWFLIAALSSLPLWYLTTDPLWAVAVLTTVDILGFGPTLRKAYAQPHQESVVFFLVMVLRNGMSVLALEYYSVATVLFPAATAAACLILIAVVVVRRKAARP